MEIEKRGPDAQRLERFQTLQAGQYWRARDAVNAEGIEAGEVLLLQSIRWVDDAAHTIILRAHPLKHGSSRYHEYVEDGETKKTWVNYGEHRFLLDTFLRLFQFEPDAAAIRKAELLSVQVEVESIKAELDDFKTDPETVARIVDNGLRDAEEKEAAKGGPKLPALSPEAQADIARVATGSVSNALSAGITEQKIEMLRAAAGRELAIATIKSTWISKQTDRISTTIAKMTPFFAEEGAAALAQFEDMRTFVANLNNGIGSLDLYVGKGVETFVIREGEPAPAGEPLSIVQKKRCIDQELALHVDVNEWFDASQIGTFYKEMVSNDALVQQIFPTERCVLVMATTQRYIDYGKNDMASALRNNQNRQVMIFVRNGWNIHVVHSPVETHLGAHRLFPRRTDGDRIFRGVDGGQIKFNDLAFTDKLSLHESEALHYKRFLILLAGLDHRKKLLGDFYDEHDALEFISEEFQDKYFRFIRDDDNSANLPTEKRQTVQSWIREMNSYVQAGSRLMADWSTLMTLETAPSAFEKSSYHRSDSDRRKIFSPEKRFSVAVLSRDDTDLVTDVEVTGESQRLRERKFKAKVNLSKYSEPYGSSEHIPYLCLDKVSPEDVRWYMHNRGARTNHIAYIRMFKVILATVEAERAQEAPTRALMAQALRDGKVVTESEISATVDDAVATWRAKNRGRPLPVPRGNLPPAEWKSLLDLMFHSASDSGERESMAITLLEAMGYVPLRMSVGGDGRVAVYAAPSASERDDRLEPFVWVHRIVLDFKNGEASERSRRWVTVQEADASEKVLREWDHARGWFGLKSAYTSPAAKREALSAFSSVAERIAPFLTTLSPEAFEQVFDEWNLERTRANSHSKHVVNLSFCLPVGIVADEYHETYVVALLAEDAHTLLYEIAPDDQARDRVSEAFKAVFSDKDRGEMRLRQAVKKGNAWSLISMPYDGKPKSRSFITSSDHYGDIRWGHVDPTMDAVFTDWVLNKGKKTSFFIDGIRREDGTFRLNEILGLEYPADYGPFHIVFAQAKGSNPLVELAYGILVEAAAEKIDHNRSTLWEGEKVSWISVTHTLATMREAAEYATGKGREMELTVKHHSELPDAPRPPDGVDRWYLVRE